MAQACSCHPDSAVEAMGRVAECGPSATVGDVVRDLPGAREVLSELGINHCCGAHLTLAEAAASAGVPLEAVLAKLGDRRRGPA